MCVKGNECSRDIAVKLEEMQCFINANSLLNYWNTVMFFITNAVQVKRLLHSAYTVIIPPVEARHLHRYLMYVW